MAHGLASAVTHGVNYSLKNNAGDWTGGFDKDGYPVMSVAYSERHGQEVPTSTDQSWAAERGYVPYDHSEGRELAQLSRSHSDEGTKA